MKLKPLVLTFLRFTKKNPSFLRHNLTYNTLVTYLIRRKKMDWYSFWTSKVYYSRSWMFPSWELLTLIKRQIIYRIPDLCTNLIAAMQSFQSYVLIDCKNEVKKGGMAESLDIWCATVLIWKEFLTAKYTLSFVIIYF